MKRFDAEAFGHDRAADHELCPRIEELGDPFGSRILRNGRLSHNRHMILISEPGRLRLGDDPGQDLFMGR